MPFELGGHEAYATRLLPNERMADCFVRFEGSMPSRCSAWTRRASLTLPKTAVPLE